MLGWCQTTTRTVLATVMTPVNETAHASMGSNVARAVLSMKLLAASVYLPTLAALASFSNVASMVT